MWCMYSLEIDNNLRLFMLQMFSICSGQLVWLYTVGIINAITSINLTNSHCTMYIKYTLSFILTELGVKGISVCKHNNNHHWTTLRGDRVCSVSALGCDA